MIRACLGAAVLGLAPVSAVATEPLCETGRFESVPYTACTLDPSHDDVRLFYRTAEGDLIGSFSALGDVVAASGRRLLMATNGGMYHPDRRPVGLYVENGREIAPLILSDGPGNFGLLPNGVLCLTRSSASVIESRAFAERAPACTFATQSGPLMVASGRLHPRFLPDSASRFIRSGVGVRPGGELVIAISDAPVNFHRFARLFRDGLGTPDALYIDGRVSRLFAPEVGRADIGLPLGPLLAVVGPGD